MCLIIHKPVGKALSTSLIKYCFATNKDGAGYMFPYKGKVIIHKGFMDYHSLIASLQQTIDLLGGSVKSVPMILHFRIGTQGGTRPEMCHPYPVCRDYQKMKELDQEVDLAMAHNGIIRSCSSPLVHDHNDSMEFIHEIAYDVINNDSYFYKNPAKIRLLDRFRETSRLVFMNGRGEVIKLGNWVPYEGYYLSHPIFKL